MIKDSHASKSEETKDKSNSRIKALQKELKKTKTNLLARKSLGNWKKMVSNKKLSKRETELEAAYNFAEEAYNFSEEGYNYAEELEDYYRDLNRETELRLNTEIKGTTIKQNVLKYINKLKQKASSKKIEKLKATLIKIDKDNVLLNDDRVNLENKIADLGDVIHQQETNLNNVLGVIETQQEKLNLNQSHIDSLKTELEDSLNDSIALSDKNNLIEGKISVLITSNDKLKTELKSKETNSTEKDANLKLKNEIIKEREQRIKELRSELLSSETQYKEIVDDIESRITKLRSENDAQKKMILKLKTTIKELKDIDVAQAEENAQKAKNNSNEANRQAEMGRQSQKTSKKTVQDRESYKRNVLKQLGLKTMPSPLKKSSLDKLPSATLFLNETDNGECDDPLSKLCKKVKMKSTGTGTNPVVKSKKITIGTQTHETDSETTKLTKRINKFEKLINEYTIFKNKNIKTVIKTIETLISRYNTATEEEIKSIIKSSIDTYMDNGYEQFLVLYRKKIFEINLTKKQIKTLRAELEKNIYGIEPSKLEEFKEIFKRLLVDINSIIEDINTLFQTLIKTKDDVLRLI